MQNILEPFGLNFDFESLPDDFKSELDQGPR